MNTTTATRVRAHAAWELGLLLRNGEQLLLTVIIPVVLLVGLRAAGDIGQAAPTVIAISVLATSFTSLAIATGFERRSGALAYLGTTPLTRTDLLAGKFLATAALTLLSVVVTVIAALLLGWQPNASWAAAVLFVVLGGAAGSSWAVFLAGALRAEAVLAVANGLFVVLAAFGGMVIPASAMPAPLSAVVSLLPSAALADGMRHAFIDGALSITAAAVLVGWALVGAVLARRTFQWD